MAKTDPKKLLAHGVHLGHKKSKVHPKANRYIHSFQNGTSIIDLIKTAELLDVAKKQAEQLGKDGKTLLVIATKKLARKPVSEICKEHGVSYMTNKWVAGFITNFPEISQNMKRMNDARKAQADGAWNDLPNHEKVQNEKKLNKKASIYGGVSTLTKAPDAIFVIDIRKEANAVNEALQSKLPVIGVVDTNVNPEDITFPIPANDDAITSIEYVAKEIIEAYASGKAKQSA